jgi:hypothetical protein
VFGHGESSDAVFGFLHGLDGFEASRSDVEALNCVVSASTDCNGGVFIELHASYGGSGSSKSSDGEPSSDVPVDDGFVG